MRISAKPWYKLFGLVHNYFLWMFPIIEKIYDDRFPPKCHLKLSKIAKKLKPKCKYILNHSTIFSAWFTTTFNECVESLEGYMMIVSIQNVPKNLKNVRKRKTWKWEYLLNHSTNFSAWFTTTFNECVESLEGYIMIVSLQNVPKNLESCEKRKTWKCEYLLNQDTNFSVWFTTNFYEPF